MKYLILVFLAIIISLKSFPQDSLNIVSELINAEHLKYSSISLLVIDNDTQDTIINHNNNKVLVPASTLKLYSTASALEIAGPNYRFKTHLSYSGKIDTNGKLNGNIFIIGNGDPSFASKRYNQENILQQFAQEIINLGITEIDGSIIGDPSNFGYPQTNEKWVWEDIANYFASPSSGLCYNENLYEIYFNTGTSHNSDTKIVKIYPQVIDYTFVNQVTSSSINHSDNAYIFGGINNNTKIVSGTLPVNKTDFIVKGLNGNPALTIAKELSNILENHNIKVSNSPTYLKETQTRPKTQTIYSHNSPSIKQLIKSTNYFSVNLYAENLLKLANIKTNSHDNCKHFWKNKGLNTDGLNVLDGSGLSHFNTISADQIVFILNYMYSSKNYEIFKNSLPKVGVNGTVKWYCRENAAKGKIYAKSGSMTRVKCFAGYINTNSNRNLSFALIINNFTGTSKQIKPNIEKTFNDITVNY